MLCRSNLTPIELATHMANVNIQEGEAVFDVPSAGKPCKTHYWIVGDLKSGKTPVVILHGGPGATHHYVSIHDELYKLHGIPVILYDQIGNGNSTHLQEKMGDTDFWTVQLFIDELNNLLKHLGIDDAYDILGHSWGGMLAMAFAVRQPKGLRRLILASPIARMKDWIDASVYLRSLLPKETQETLAKHEAAGTTDSKEFQAAEKEYYDRYVCKIESKELGESFSHLLKDPTVYFTM